MLNFFGIGSCFNTKLGNTSAFYLHEDELNIIDCGETVFADILSSKILEKDIKFVNIIITHMHSDHVGSLPSLVLYLKFVKNIRYRIVCHPLIWDKITTFLNICGVPDKDIHVGEDPVSSFITNLEFIYTTHCPIINSFHLDIITIDGKRIFYSGDCSELYPKFDASNYDYMFLEASSHGDIHMDFNTIVKKIPKSKRHKVQLMHLDNMELIYKGQEAGFKIAQRIRL